MGTRLERAAAGLLALVLAACSVQALAAWKSSRADVLEILARYGTGARAPGVVSDVRREPDAVRARLLAARALVAEELDRRWLADLGPAEREAAEALATERLETADSLAREVLASLPASWQARMILAAATYLEMSRSGAPNRWRERARWERPLRDAMAIATSQVEPRRILAAAYLNDWSLMNAQERESARDVLRVAFRDRATLEQLLPAWLRRAGSLDRALDLIPADLWSWQIVERTFRARQDWERVCEARQRSLVVLPEYMAKVLAEAERRLRGGDAQEARSLALLALADLPVGPVHAELLERLLQTLPPGPIPARHRQRTREWLEWARRECLLHECPLPPAAARRLLVLSRFESPADRAWAAELAGDVYSAEANERTGLVPNDRDWGPYLLLKAKRLARTGRAAEAAASMALLHPDWTDRAVTRAVDELIREELGSARPAQPADWRSAAALLDGRTSVREFFWRQPPEKVRLRFGAVASAGAAVEILWSGRASGCHRVDPRATLTVTAPRSSGFQILEVRPVAGNRAGLLDVEVIP